MMRLELKPSRPAPACGRGGWLGRGAALLLAAGALAGCTRQEAEFSHRAQHAELMPEVQQVIHDTLQNRFGSPTDMVAWERLPLKLHAAVGVAAGEPDPKAVTVSLSETNLPVHAGDEAVWLSGRLLQQQDSKLKVRSFDPAQGLVEFESPLAMAPAAGDRVALGPGEVLKQGRMLYAEHCIHCHGVNGDGNGPTAPYLNPRPRDYRLGTFKFTTTKTGLRGRRDDLSRILSEGIPGTYMPSFKLLTPEENFALVEYVLWLSMRGEVEYQLVAQLGLEYSQAAFAERIAGGESEAEIVSQLAEFVNGGDFATQIDEIGGLVAERWTTGAAEESLVVPTVRRPEATPESIARGRLLYLSKDLNCIACHGDAGLGDGPQTYSITKNAAGEDNPAPGLYDDWGNPLAPRNLTSGIYRGGRRPIDLFCRIYSGIKGTPMPAFGGKKTDEEIWDLVNYIYSVPFETRQPGDGAKEAPPPSSQGVAAN